MIGKRWTLPLSYTHRTYAKRIVRLRQHGTFLFCRSFSRPVVRENDLQRVKIQRLRTS